MNFSSKIWAGLILLLVLIVTVAGIGIFVLLDTANRGKAVIQDNFLSVEYTHDLLQALNRFPDPEAQVQFSRSLKLEANNITEPGEDSLVNLAEAGLKRYQSALAADSLALLPALKASLQVEVLAIMKLNLDASLHKNSVLNDSIQSNSRLLTIGYTIVFLILFSMLFNYPQAIIHPMQELVQRIKEVAGGNYDQRVDIDEAGEMEVLATAFNEMAAQLSTFKKSSLAQVMFEQSRLQTVLSSLKDALIMLDENHQVLYINPVAQKILHLRPDQVVHMQAKDLAMKHDLFNNLYDQLNHPATEEEPPLIVVSEGKEQFFRREMLSIEAVDPVNGTSRGVGYVFLLRNVTQFSELDRAKTDFLATVSHELKTPLSSINLSLKLLYDPRMGMLNDAQNQLVDKSREEVKHMLQMVGELIKLSQLETGRIKLHPIPSPISPILQRAATCVEAQALAGNVTVVLKPDIPDMLVLADADKTAWVFANLLGNAVRYSPAGTEVQINWQLERNHLLVGVGDQGPGIPEGMLERIFERYVTLPVSGRENEPGGSGLGLAIAREFMLAQGGKIWAESKPGLGATFWVQFQRA